MGYLLAETELLNDQVIELNSFQYSLRPEPKSMNQHISRYHHLPHFMETKSRGPGNITPHCTIITKPLGTSPGPIPTIYIIRLAELAGTITQPDNVELEEIRRTIQ